MKKGVLLFGVFFVSCLLRAQNTGQQPYMIPADEIILQQTIAKDPGIIANYMIYEDNLQRLINAQKTDTLIGGKRIIPIVFHIIHVYGSENISDAQVLDAVNLINIDYNKQNADTAETFALFQSRAADCQIEFRLAKKDPQGNCTSGILRHYDPQTNYAYFTTMHKYAWPPSNYLNVFVVSFIYPEGMSLPDGAFIGGMSPFPPSNTLSQALTGGDTLMDGVLIRHDGIGSIGTATTMGGMPINSLNRTFTHESGHYFNLYHPFQNLMFGLLPASSGCPDMFAPNGDEVDDTPPVDVATQNTSLTCFTPGSRNTCDQDDPDEPDMIENYMDYQFGYCTNIFTLGQYNRMNAALNSDRRHLWSFENLEATGVLDTNIYNCTPVADFFTTTNMVCAGSNVIFTDATYNGIPDTWDWSFAGGSPATSNDQNPTISYANAGIYEVTLTVSNASGTDAITRNSYIHVIDQAMATDAPYTESFETINLNTEYSILNDTANTWETISGTAYTGTKCVWIDNFGGNTSGSADVLISPSFDLSVLPSTSHAMISVKYAYAGKIIPGTILTADDTAFANLKIYVSTDCGKTWIYKTGKSGISLATADPTETAFTPSSQSDWDELSFPIISSTLPNYSNTRLKFEFYQNGGNNIYIDDINIYSLAASIEEPQQITELNIYPNPATDKANIEFQLTEPSNVNIQLTDLQGREVRQMNQGDLPAGHYHFTIERGQLNSGVYYLHISIDESIITRSLVF